jgi:hypothetical protein
MALINQLITNINNVQEKTFLAHHYRHSFSHSEYDTPVETFLAHHYRHSFSHSEYDTPVETGRYCSFLDEYSFLVRCGFPTLGQPGYSQTE